MDGADEIDVNLVIDTLPVRGITWLVLGLCFAAMLSEGYNLGVPGLAAPGIIKSFAVTRAQLTPVFSAALVGMLVGALASGFIGDRFGRKRGMLLATLVIAAASFGCAAAQNLSQLLVLRFLVGVGLGGLLPNGAALMAELTPRKVRATFTTYAFIGIITGGTLPALIGALLEPSQWRILFLAGGALSALVLPLLFFLLPESVKFLALDSARAAELRALLGIMTPDLPVKPGARFVLNENRVNFSLASLFAGRLAFITPALWLVFILVMLVNFFINSWLTLLLQDMGFAPSQAAAITSLYYVGGITGGLVVGAALDRIGPAVLGFYGLAGAAATFLVGIPGHSESLSALLVGLIGFGVLGLQVGLSGMAGLLYPTWMRSKGAGFAHSLGRLGGIGGPLIAGAMMANGTGIFTLFLVPVAAQLLAIPCCIVITAAWTGRFSGRALAAMTD